MAASFVRATQGTASSDTLTLNIQSSGTNRVMVVGLAYKSNNVITPDSILFNTDEDLVELGSAADGGDAQCLMWYLAAPTVTTADVVISLPSSVRMVGYVALFTGIDQSNPFTANKAQAQGTDNAPTVDITSATDEICVDMLSQVSAGPDTATATHTEICNGAVTGGGTDTRGAGQYVAGVTTRTMNYSISSDDHWNIMTGALQPAGGTTAQAMSATATGIATLTLISTFARTLASTATALGTLTRINSFFRTLSSSATGVGTLATVSTYLRTLAQSANAVGTLTPASLVSQALSATASSVATMTAVRLKILSMSATALATGTLTTIATFARTLSGAATAVGTLTATRIAIQSMSAVATAVGTLASVQLKIVTMTSTVVATATMTAVQLKILSMSATALATGTMTRLLSFAKTLSSTATAVGTLVAAKFILQAMTATATAVGTTTRKIGQLTIGAKTILNLGTGGIMGKIKDKIYIPF